MSVSKTVKYDPKITEKEIKTLREKRLVENMMKAMPNLTAEEARARLPREPHVCNPPKLTEELGLGIGSIWACQEKGDFTGGNGEPCNMQKEVVHLGIKQLDDSLPYAWRNLGRIGV